MSKSIYEEVLEQKQEKLSHLYKEYFRLSTIPKIAFNIQALNRLKEIKNEIRELEK